MTERVCPECSAAFMPRYGSQVCCGDACKKVREKRLYSETKKEKAQRLTLAEKRREKAARRKAFFAARDAAFAKAGLPVPRIVIKDGGRIEYRGRCVGGYGPSRVPHC